LKGNPVLNKTSMAGFFSQIPPYSSNQITIQFLSQQVYDSTFLKLNNVTTTPVSLGNQTYRFINLTPSTVYVISLYDFDTQQFITDLQTTTLGDYGQESTALSTGTIIAIIILSIVAFFILSKINMKYNRLA
jgi:hypothetical protein